MIALQKKTLIAIGLILATLQLNAQRFVTTNDFDRISKFTVGVNMNTYFGELRRLQDAKLQAGLGFGIGYEHLMTDNLGLRANFSIYSIKADDALSPIPANRTRNINFKATNIEFVVEGMYYIFRHPAQGYGNRAFVNPYLHLGAGVTSNNPKQELNGTSYDVRPLRLEGVQYGGLAFVVPVGVGLDFYISRNIDLQLDLQYTLAFTGQLDNVSTLYRDPSSFTDTNGVPANTMAMLSDPRTALDPPLSPVAAGTRRGNGTNDSYLRLGFKVAYYLPKSLFGKSSIRCRVLKKTR